MPRGPKLYQPPKGGPERQSGPGDPPPGFINSANSVPEWRCYWAAFKALKIDADPRQPPFEGYPGRFAYQDPFEGGRHGPGGQVFDFVFYSTRRGTPMIVRVQTDHFHYNADVQKQALDAYLLTRAARFYEIRDIYDYQLMADDTGESAVIALKNVLAGNDTENPLTANVARRMT